MTIQNVNPNPFDPGSVTPSPLSGYERIPIEGGTLVSGAVVAAISDTSLMDQTVTATGTTRADAYAITGQITNVTTAAASTGVVLNSAIKPGMKRFLFNSGANPIQVYAAGSDTIDGVAGATGVPLANAKRAIFFCVQTGKWISAQLGVVSA